MSKRNKRQSRKTPAASPASFSSAVEFSSAKSFDSEFNPDYSQTIKDLKRIGILAGTFFAILVGLAFFLR
jgi:hypothetical protein